MKLAFELFNNQLRQISTDGLLKIAKNVWSAEAKQNAAISIILVDDEQLVLLNQQFLHKTYQTDVIAFTLSEPQQEIFEGEIYVSVDRVIENAGLYKVEPSHELKRTVIHGLLHFLGYKDKEPADKQKMRTAENLYLKKYEI